MYANLPVWKQSPFIRIIPAFIIGITLQWYLHFTQSIIIAGFICFLFPVLIFTLFPIHKQFRFRFINGFSMLMLMGFFGMMISFKADIRNDTYWYGHHYKKGDLLLLRLIEPPVEKNKTFKCVTETEAIINGTVKAVKGNIVIYFKKSDSFSLVYGDRILADADVMPVNNSGNPGAFDYKRYMKLHSLFHQVFVPENKYVLWKHSPSSFFNFIFNVRDRAVEILKKNISGQNNIALAEALIIGYREELDKDLVQAYSNAGVVHIISVSGLHLGLVYVLLTWILLRLPYIKTKKIIQWVLIIIALWLFALVTGGSPSALRSAVMFSFIITGKTFFKQHNTYNALCSSAFILLCTDPNYLWDVGFQLSYIAVFGIVWLQSPINKLVYFKNKYLHKLWGLLSVTISAQLITSPLCIYYFHQFPNFFLITNIIAVPASTAILFGGILLFCVSPIPFLASITGKGIGYMISGMNWFIVELNKIPFSVTDHLQLSALSMWLLYGLILCIAAAIFFERHKMFMGTIICFMLFMVDQTLKSISESNQHKMIVYNIPKISTVHFIYGRRSMLCADTSLLTEGMHFNFHVKPAQILYGVESLLNKSIIGNEIYLFNNKIILNIFKPEKFANTMKVDIVILSKNVRLSIEEISLCQPSLIIFDSSNSLWKIEQWKKDCEKLHLQYYSVPSSGAYILDQ